ncbi:DUF3619 family protein [Pelomonas baiyunensis]|uniref:DUF3619 family protein n=1 Tax=Pelomonas baiyunensis TaxID=3299026 RepID=A0ABW7GV51_9BURK
MNKSNHTTREDVLETRVSEFGRRVAAHLSEQQAALPHDVTERLRFAREQALQRAAQARAAQAHVAAAASSTTTVQMGATLALQGGAGRPAGDERGLWAKLISALPLLALLAGLVLMQQSRLHQQIVAAGEVDTALLSDQLPPDAFRDPGFAEFLRDGQE